MPSVLHKRINFPAASSGELRGYRRDEHPEGRGILRSFIFLLIKRTKTFFGVPLNLTG